jgi:hypothetical protein
MSVLFFDHQPEQVILITDTLATDPDGTAKYFVNKVFSYPTMDMVMAATGIYQLALKWNEYLLERLIVKDIDNLNDFASTELQHLWSSLREEHHFDDRVTCTIYHFGWSEKDKQYIRYIYRSADNFASEKHLEGGIGIKPHPTSREDMKNLTPFELVKKIKSEQDELPHSKKLYIGGNLVVTILSRDTGIQSKLIHRFDDYEKHWLEMNAKLG